MTKKDAILAPKIWKRFTAWRLNVKIPRFILFNELQAFCQGDF